MTGSRVLPPIACAAALASAADAPLPPHKSLYETDYVTLVKPAENGNGVLTLIDVEGQPFKQAVRVVNLKRMERFYDLQMVVDVPEAVSKGDTILVCFFARGEAPKNETGEADAQVYFQKNTPDYSKDLSERFSVGPEWKRFNYPFKIMKPLGAGETALCFGTGFNEQAIEIGGVELLRFEKGVKMGDLPQMPVRYPGSTPDAPWRAEAATRIEQHRKSDMTVQVVDAVGNPVSNAKVEIAMTRHAFQFSSVVSIPTVAKGDADAETYKQKVLELFNASGNENACKWPAWEGIWKGAYTQENTLDVFKWLKENGLHVRGHVMVWPSWKHVPKHIKDLENEPDKLREAVRAHIMDIATKTKDVVDEWDVINETRSNHDLMDVCGREVMVEWFKTAREAVPDKDLFINDFGILNSGPNSGNSKTYRNTIKFLLENEAPVTGIGLQSHIGSNLPDPASVVRTLDSFSHFGLKMRITEFDVDIANEDAQARFTRDFMTAVFSHPGVVGFQMWGFWEGRHWKPKGAMYRQNWEEKPNAKAYKDLVFGEWWTRAEGTTDVAGTFTARGFLGDYKVTAAQGDRVKTVTVKLGHDADVVKVVLE